jgi:PAS domain S-box-containing protein
MLKRLSFKLKTTVLISAVLTISLFAIQIMLILELLNPSYSLLIVDFAGAISFVSSIFIISKEIRANQRLEKIKKNTLEEIINESALVSRADAKGKITYVNGLFCDTSGYKKHELLGKDHSILNSGKHDREFWNQMYQSVVKHRTIWNEIITNKRKDGSEYIVDSWITSEFDEKGNHIGYFSTRHDLTDLYKSLTETKDRQQELSAIMKGIDQSSATLEFCMNGFIINANQKFLELSGYGTLHEITGKHHSIFMDPIETKSKEYEKFWSDLKSGKPRSGEFQKIKKDGTIFWVSCTYNPIIDSTGKMVKILEIANDITESITQKIDLERKNAYLEHAAKILRHDMHSGINTYIPRGISSLERRINKFAKDNDLDESQMEKIFGTSMKLIKEGLHHSQKVYSGVKEFTNLVKKDSQLEKQRTDLTEALKEYLKSTAYSSSVIISDLGEEEVNPSLFCTAIDNLIRNGLKYNDSDTKIIKIYRDKECIIVEDNGRGMTQSEFEEYSKPYTRKKDNTESGSGLGLNICIAIVKEHGWTLGILKSRKGTKMQICMDK